MHPRLYGQLPDVGQEDHGLPFLGGAHPGSDMGLVRSRPTLGDPCHSHARRRHRRIHCDNGATEGCQHLQVMEPDPRLGFRGQALGGGGQDV